VIAALSTASPFSPLPLIHIQDFKAINQLYWLGLPLRNAHFVVFVDHELLYL
jgi:hypothetical protein